MPRHKDGPGKLTLEIKKSVDNPVIKKYIAVKRDPKASLDTLIDFKNKEEDEQVISWVMYNLEEWSALDTSIMFFDFLDTFGIPENTFYKWLRRHDTLQMVHSHALQRIGSRRHKLAIFKSAECNEKSLLHTLRVYSKEHRDCYDEDVAKKKFSDFEGGMTRMVVVKDFPSSSD